MDQWQDKQVTEATRQAPMVLAVLGGFLATAVSYVKSRKDAVNQKLREIYKDPGHSFHETLKSQVVSITNDFNKGPNGISNDDVRNAFERLERKFDVHVVPDINEADNTKKGRDVRYLYKNIFTAVTDRMRDRPETKEQLAGLLDNKTKRNTNLVAFATGAAVAVGVYFLVEFVTRGNPKAQESETLLPEAGQALASQQTPQEKKPSAAEAILATHAPSPSFGASVKRQQSEALDRALG